MALPKLWQKLFSNNDKATEIALHTAGTTIRKKSPFDSLESYHNKEELSQEFIKKWVSNFYMNLVGNLDEEGYDLFINASREITPEITKQLLGSFNWRPRIVGAYFAGIKNYHELKDIIGVHLLKSEVCYAGAGYALALAVFGDDNSKAYLNLYLDYYLNRKDLWFDQASVLSALYIIDSERADAYLGRWKEFVADKPYWNLENSKAGMSKSIKLVKELGKV